MKSTTVTLDRLGGITPRARQRDSARRAPAGDELQSFVVESIRRGALQPGDMIPGQTELARRFRIGEVTVRRTLGRLQNEGLLRREQGRGTIITPQAYQLVRPQNHSGQVLLAMRAHGHTYADLLQKLVHSMNGRTQIPAVLALDQEDGHPQPIDQLASLLDSAVQGEYAAAIFEHLDSKESNVWETILEAARVLKRRGVPLLWLLAAKEELPDDLDADLISMDYRAGMAQATRHLIDQGYERIAFLAPHRPGGQPTASPHVTPFLDGYRRTMESAGLASYVRVIETPPRGQRQSYAEQVLGRSDRPSAIVASQDFALTAYVKAAQKLGLEISNDLGLVGFFNTPWAATYELTSLDLCLDLLVHHVVGWLSNVQARGLGHAATLIQPKLVVRASSVRRGGSVPGRSVAEPLRLEESETDEM